MIRANTSALSLLVLAAAPVFAQVKLAENNPADPRASFERGIFKLPPVLSEKDVYTIVIEPVGEKERTLVLPPGTIGLHLSDSAIPPGDWSWRYLVSRVDLKEIHVLEPAKSPAMVTYSSLLRSGDAVHLNWEAILGAATYRVTMRTDKAIDLALTPDWGSPSNTDLIADEAVNAALKVGYYDLPLKSNTRLEWTVTALDADGQPMAKSSPRIVQSEAPRMLEWSRKGWSLQRSDTLSKEATSKAALFGYSSSQKAGSPRSRAYQGEFALIWDETKKEAKKEPAPEPLFYLRSSLEARLHSSGADKDDDALKFRFGGYRLLTSHPAEVVANLKYETESKGDTKKGLMEFGYTPLALPLHRFFPARGEDRNAAGNLRPESLPWSQWMLQATLGAELGKTFSVGSSKEVRKSNFRQKASLRLDGQLNGLADALRLPQVSMYLTSTYWHLSREKKGEHTHSTLGMSFKLTNELSIEATYSVGADAPKFTFSRSSLVGLGLKF